MAVPSLATAATPATDATALAAVLERVRLCARRRAGWLRRRWEAAAPGNAHTISHAEADALVVDADAPEHEARAWADDPELADTNRAIRDCEAWLRADDRSRIARLTRTFALSPDERDWLDACLALSLDPALGRLYAYLQDHAGRSYVTEPLVARLFGHGRVSPIGAESPLIRCQLVLERDVGPGEPREVTCDPAIRAWLLGSDALDAELVDVAHRIEPRPPLASWPLDATVDAVSRAVGDHATPLRLRISGQPGSGRRTFAATVADRLGLPLLCIDVDAIADADWPRRFTRAQRQAFLSRAALAWYGDKLAHRAWPASIAPFPLQFVIGDAQPPRTAGLADRAIELPTTSIDERARLWRACVPSGESWPDADVTRLARTHRVTPGDIVAVARAAPATAADAGALVRLASAQRLGELAQPLDASFEWSDLVLPSYVRGALADFAFEAEARTTFWQDPNARRLFPQGRGLMALLCGPPGTGKTMAAQVIARSLGLDLFRIDLSAVVSKWVGETSRNLERILARAAHMDVVLLFDEADSLFCKRTDVRDAQDRFANTDTNYLLQAVESYAGVALLATNRRTTIDPAFVRRLRFVIELPPPGPVERREMWGRMITALAGAAAATTLASELDQLAQAIELTGAQIKQALLSAMFGARRAGRELAREHLVRGIERELHKEGRALDARTRDRGTLDGR